MAIVMGLLIPSMFFTIAEKVVYKKMSGHIGETIPETTGQSSNETEYLPEEDVNTISVLLKNGTVQKMNIDAYLIGVILGEMPADFENEALRAQTVVARTYARKRQSTGDKHPNGAVCTESSCCQAYVSATEYISGGGTQEAVNKVASAVYSTGKQVLTYQGSLIEATYFACSGGRTEDAQAVWGTDIPYLKSVDSPGEEHAVYHTDVMEIPRQKFTQLLQINPQGAPSGWFGPVTYTAGGGVNSMEIAGRIFSGTELRQKLNLRSTAFVMVAMGDVIHIFTRGFGHRVGMSQYGAEAMAVKGHSYQEILAHYYPGTILKTDS